MTKVSGPELLGVCHESIEILFETPIVESFEGGSIIKVLALRIGGISVLAKDTQLQVLGPPVMVAKEMLVSRNIICKAYASFEKPKVGPTALTNIPSATTSNIAFLVCNWAFTHDVLN
jgi:hypothetical protein